MKSIAIPLLRLRFASRASLAVRLPHFIALMKPRVMALAVFTALVYNLLDTPVFVLFLVVLALIILIVKSFADTRRALEIKVKELVAAAESPNGGGQTPPSAGAAR